MTKLDPRRHAYRADLVAETLRGSVQAENFVAGQPHHVAVPSLPLRREPRFDSTLDTDALLGEAVTVYDENEGWAWVQLDHDGYVGYMPSEGLMPGKIAPTQRVAALRTYVFPEPDSKVPPLALLSLNANVTVAKAVGSYLQLESGGFVYGNHAVPLGVTAPDYVSVAEAFLGTPYLWGGRTSVGTDCSGLLQLAAAAAGHSVPRDADMQAAETGDEVDWQGGAELARGDLVFWDGHVGIMTSADYFLHANAFHMAVENELFSDARDRIKAAGFEVTGVQRLPLSGDKKAR